MSPGIAAAATLPAIYYKCTDFILAQSFCTTILHTSLAMRRMGAERGHDGRVRVLVTGGRRRGRQREAYESLS